MWIRFVFLCRTKIFRSFGSFQNRQQTRCVCFELCEWPHLSLYKNLTGWRKTYFHLSFAIQEQKEALVFAWLYALTMIALSFSMCVVYNVHKKYCSRSQSHDLADSCSTVQPTTQISKDNEKSKLARQDITSHGVFNPAFSNQHIWQLSRNSLFTFIIPHFWKRLWNLRVVRNTATVPTATTLEPQKTTDQGLAGGGRKVAYILYQCNIQQMFYWGEDTLLPVPAHPTCILSIVNAARWIKIGLKLVNVMCCKQF